MAFRSLNVASLGLKPPLSHATEISAGDRLVSPDQLVEIEAVAALPPRPANSALQK